MGEQVKTKICTKCGKLLGNAKDDVEILKEAIKYLERNQ